MNVTCPECATTYRVDPLKVPAGGVRARCANCPAEFLVSVDSVVPAFTAAVATGVESAAPAVEESAAYATDTSTYETDGSAYETESSDTADTTGVDVSHEAPDPDGPVDTFADSFSTYHADDEAGEEETEIVSVGNNDLSRGRVAVYFDTEETGNETETEEETLVAVDSSDPAEYSAGEDDDVDGEIGIAVTVETASSWSESGSDSTEVAITEAPDDDDHDTAGPPSEDGDDDTTGAASDDTSGVWAARTTDEDADDQPEADHEAVPDFDSSSVFTRDTFAPVVPVTTDEHADDTVAPDAGGYETAEPVEDDDPHAGAEETPVAAHADDRDEGADTGASGNDASADGWEESGHADEGVDEGADEEYGQTTTLEEVEAPAGFAAVQQSRSDADLSLPPAPFGSADPNARAQSLARALVSDIVVYHRDRRDRSIRAGTLRQEFREEIRKSWDEYVSHVGNQIARDTSYFRDALNEVLAGGQQLF
jgi:predicted Zn finger-like uncharacterized protein